ncbi:MAG: hypothetical protein OEY16_13695 [Alphaproteobacteria bacterium]|nr:hypothetical protein [Alphaproteobacteria bacterium]
MTGADRDSLLDGPAARIFAVAVALAGMAFLGWMHRNDLFPPEPDVAADPRQAAFQACYAPQAERIARDAESGQLNAEQAALFKNRAEAFCADQAEKGRLPPQ